MSESSAENLPASPPVTGKDLIREFSDRLTLWLLEDPANLRDQLRLLDL